MAINALMHNVACGVAAVIILSIDDCHFAFYDYCFDERGVTRWNIAGHRINSKQTHCLLLVEIKDGSQILTANTFYWQSRKMWFRKMFIQ